KRFDSIGPTIGRELKRNAAIALVVAIIAIVLYIAWAFRHVSEPVSSWKYGVAAVIALIHDVTIPTAVFALLGKFSGVPIDALFITALLTIMGFSVHDTIVVFDRTRENLRKLKGREEFSVTVNRSVNETFTRSINTSVTILLALVAIVVFGGESVRYFALALIIGIVFGTYSSIFIASPLLVLWNDLTKKK
ncbi:MAG: protein-export membrane protein SecF, partial [Candidatus Yanofskybacteria bacterium RIFCSPLOWO2_01_FULL_44_22]